MEMNTLSLLVPAMQSKLMSPQPGGGRQTAAFAGLLAMLQQLPGLGPQVAVAAAQAAGSEEEAGALPKLLAALLPQMMPQATSDGGGSPLFQENGATGSAALWLPAVLRGLPLQLGELAEGGASGSSSAGGSTVLSGKALPLDAAAALQDAVVANLGAEKLLPEPVTAVFQAVAAAEAGAEKLPPETLLAEQNRETADKTAASAKPASVEKPLLHLHTADKVVVDLPVSHANRAEPLSTIQAPSSLGYQAFSERQALSATAVRFAESPLGRAAVAEQALEKMVFRREAEGDSTLSVRLRPAALGEVQISLRLEDGRLMARIMTENLYVKEALDAALGQVKQRLEAQQIQVAELTVTVGSQQDFRQERSFSPFWQQTEVKGKRSAMAAAAAERGGQPVSLRQALVDVRV
ncbi:MAG: flagellar hook-length control protein FliK [Dethiobacter sp.]|jgi:flagellar hook-length control protein FliK|nr:flagellar hook-length control protein FliK [Dethiobacter sp.]MBS3902180.1 flagellar hook-length control protein FliK [Dethiobacter sp.]MBS3988605.1 flagellar hook-length control protein FliK [Dethiobacter sp.]